MQHVTVYREKGRYAGWPANYGIWSWGGEIVLGFTSGYYGSEGGFHSRARNRPFQTTQARSLDGGLTWQVGEMPCRTPGGRALSADEHMLPEMGAGQAGDIEDVLKDCPGGINFTHPDFALMCARTGLVAGARSWFYVSYDRCKTWEGPFKLPMFDQKGIASRTSYLVSGPSECTLFLTTTKPDGGQGRVICARTTDGGKSFGFVSWVGMEEPEGYAIMPAAVRLPSSRVLAALRRRKGDRGAGTERAWIDLYASDDNCATWSYVNTPVPNTGVGGNPPAMIRLNDGRLCLTYGYRDAPHSICARLSEDDGKTWGGERILRSGGGNHDIGYTRTVQRPDGKIVTAYYFNDHAESERYIAATVWEA